MEKIENVKEIELKIRKFAKDYFAKNNIDINQYNKSDKCEIIVEKIGNYYLIRNHCERLVRRYDPVADDMRMYYGEEYSVPTYYETYNLDPEYCFVCDSDLNVLVDIQDYADGKTYILDDNNFVIKSGSDDYYGRATHYQIVDGKATVKRKFNNKMIITGINAFQNGVAAINFFNLSNKSYRGYHKIYRGIILYDYNNGTITNTNLYNYDSVEPRSFARKYSNYDIIGLDNNSQITMSTGDVEYFEGVHYATVMFINKNGKSVSDVLFSDGKILSSVKSLEGHSYLNEYEIDRKRDSIVDELERYGYSLKK